METNGKEKEVFQQDLKEKAKFQNLFQMQLLFRDETARPSVHEIHKALEARFGQVDIVAGAAGEDGALYTFAILKYLVGYKDQQKMPAQVLMTDQGAFDSAKIGPMPRSQLWECPGGAELLDSCRYQIMLTDFVAAGLPYLERCEMLAGWLETALELFPDCAAVWVPSSEKLLAREQLLNNPRGEREKFLYFGVNTRFFTIQGSQAMLVDTLGLYAVGLPDIQYHFCELDANAVVNHAWNAMSYVFLNNAPMKNGDTIDGITDGRIDQGVQWPCRYERALIQPVRDVMDICPGRYAAGNRKTKRNLNKQGGKY